MEMKLRVSSDPGRSHFLVKWPKRSPKLEDHLHKIGGEWNDFNEYRFPSDLATLRKINENVSGLSVADEESREYIKDLVEKSRETGGLTHGDSDAEIYPQLKKDYPETAKALRPYQRAAAKFMVINDSVLLADSPGTGKTISTISALVSDETVEGDILVLSPSIATQVTWPAELSKWAPDEEVIKATGPKGQRKKALEQLEKPRKGKRRWVLCNTEMARTKYHKETYEELTGERTRSYYEHTYPELFGRAWSAIVLDEAHRVLVTNKSQAYKQSQTRCGLGKLPLKRDGKKFALTGTPFRGKLENLWGTLNWLFPEKYTSYHRWVNQWFPTQQGFFGGTEISAIKPEKMGAFFAAIEPFTLRRTKAEIAKDLPPKTYVGSTPPGVDPHAPDADGMIGHWLEMSPKQRKAYQEMEEMAMTRLEEGVLVANGILAELTRLKQFAGTYGEIYLDSSGEEKFRPSLPSVKFDWLLEFLEGQGIVKGSTATGPESQKVVVASQFTSVLDLFSRELKKKGINHVKITGAVSGKAREEAASKFQSDSGPQVMLLNTHAGGVALTLDRADDIVILDETFIPDDQEQVEDRVHRVSRNHNVFVHYVRSIGTVEEGIAKKTFSRDSLQKGILDGERGIDFTRSILGKEQ